MELALAEQAVELAAPEETMLARLGQRGLEGVEQSFGEPVGHWQRPYIRGQDFALSVQ